MLNYPADEGREQQVSCDRSQGGLGGEEGRRRGCRPSPPCPGNSKTSARASQGQASTLGTSGTRGGAQHLGRGHRFRTAGREVEVGEGIGDGQVGGPSVMHSGQEVLNVTLCLPVRTGALPRASGLWHWSADNMALAVTHGGTCPGKDPSP